jgi:hypothetical protein
VDRILSALSVEIGRFDVSDFASLRERVDAILAPSWEVVAEIESRWDELPQRVDSAVCKAHLGTPLKNFESAWSMARTGRLPSSKFSERSQALRAAAEGDDIATLGRLLGGCDAKRVFVEHGRGIASSPDGFSLLEIACQARARASARFLLELMGCPVTVPALHAAIAGGDPELVLLIWDRLEVGARSNVEELARTAGAFHQWLVFDWLLREQSPDVLTTMARWAVKSGIAVGVLRLVGLGWDPTGADRDLAMAMSDWREVRLLEAVALRDATAWIGCVLKFGSREASAWQLDRPPCTDPDFLRLVRSCKSSPVMGMRETVRFVEEAYNRRASLDKAFVALVASVRERFPGEVAVDDALLAVSSGERESRGCSAAHVAVLFNDERQVRQAVEIGEFDEPDRDGRTPAAVALLRHRVEMLDVLLEAGAREPRAESGMLFGRHSWFARPEPRRAAVAATSLMTAFAIVIAFGSCRSARTSGLSCSCLLAGCVVASLLSVVLPRGRKIIAFSGSGLLVTAMLVFDFIPGCDGRLSGIAFG